MKTYAIINQKGGVGKSTTAQTLAAGLYLNGYKVLTVDLDPQANTSFTFKAAEGINALDVIMQAATAKEAIQKTAYGDLIPGTRDLAGTDLFIVKTGKEKGKDRLLKEALEPVKRKYDYIIIDTPPALGALTVNALTACSSVIIPAQADLYSLQGVKELIANIKEVQPKLKIEGILFTRYSARSAFNTELAELAGDMAKAYGTKVFNTKIREAVAIKKAQASLKCIFDYEPKANVAADYKAFIEELIGKEL